MLEAMRPHFLLAGNAESRHAAGRRRGGPGRMRKKSAHGSWGPTPTRSSSPRAGPRPTTWPSSAWRAWRRDPGILFEPDRASGGRRAGGAAGGGRVPRDRPAVDAEGLADAERDGRGVRRPETRLATLMLANNETGAIQPVARLAELAGRAGHPGPHRRRAGRRPDPGRFPRPGGGHPGRQRPQVPRPGGGRACCWSARGSGSAPRLFGGGQQQGRRPGTVAVPLAVGLAAALERWHDARPRPERPAGRAARPPRSRPDRRARARTGSSATARPTRR